MDFIFICKTKEKNMQTTKIDKFLKVKIEKKPKSPNLRRNQVVYTHISMEQRNKQKKLYSFKQSG